ncbi:MAG: hypothetical protein HN959_03690 [Flavobacteriaceae bacterium]|jgi:hypothetical protein|nr:hypothetical protein [Flavobacteriaceae bacterium]
MIKKILLIVSFLVVWSGATFADTEEKKICTGFGKWTKDGEYKVVRSKCITEKEYQTSLNAPDYLCKYYQKSIWKESERAYGKKQYKYTEKSLAKINALKAEGKALCEAGKLKEGELKLVEAITIISHTRMN